MPSYCTSLITKSDALLEAAETIFPESSELNQIRNAIQDLQRDLREIEGQAKTDHLIVTAVGEKNVGKSTLLRSLIRKESIAVRLKKGHLKSQGTEGLYWVGPSKPSGLIDGQEIFIPCSEAELLPLGPSYMILDCPGYGDESYQAEDLAEKAIRQAHIKLFVIQLDRWRTTAFHRFIPVLDGSCVVPIFRLPTGQKEDTFRAEVEDCLSYLQAELPNVSLSQPLVLPHFTHATEEAIQTEITLRLSKHLVTVFENLKKMETVLEDSLRGRWERFERIWERLMDPFREKLGDALQDWQTAKERIVSHIIPDLLGEPEVCRSSLRFDWRLSMVRQTPSPFFPHKAALTLLTLATGKWDKLVMGSMGSVPSLILTAVGGVGNLRRQHNFHEAMKDGLRQRLMNSSLPELKQALKVLRVKLDRTLNLQVKPAGKSAIKSRQNVPQIKWVGVEELQDDLRAHWQKTLQETRNRRSRLFNTFYGLVGTSIFLAFIGGPFYALYHEFFQAWGTPDTLTFPRNGLQVVTTGLILSLPPLFLWSMVQLVFRPRGSKVRRLEKSLREHYTAEINTRLEDRRLYLEVNDPLVEHMETLLSPT